MPLISLLVLLASLNSGCITLPEITVDVEPPGESVFAGEIVYLTAKAKNVSENKVEVDIVTTDTFKCNFDFIIHDDKGNRIRCLPDFKRQKGHIVLLPGDIIIYKKPLYLCLSRNFNEDRRYRIKAVYYPVNSYGGFGEKVIESDEKWLDVLAPKTEDDKKAYRLLYTMNPAFGFKPPDREYKYAYDQMTAFFLIPEKYPNSIYSKYALYVLGKRAADYSAKIDSTTKSVKKGQESLERLLREYPAFHLTDEAIFYLGLIHRKKGDNETARKYFNKVIKEFPHSEGAEMARRALLEGGTP